MAAKTCFVIGPMRDEAQMGRQRRLAEIMREAFAQLGHKYDVQTPVISESGDIVEQVIRELDHADIVIADLTRNNPSVLYELAVRHCIGRPCLHVVDKNASAADRAIAKIAREALTARLGKEGRDPASNWSKLRGALRLGPPVEAKEETVRLDHALALIDELGRPLAFDVGHARYVEVDFDAGAAENQPLVDLLATTVHEAEGSTEDTARNPVTAYYGGVPLTDAYPTSGLALGYLYNFLIRSAEALKFSVETKKPVRIVGRPAQEFLTEEELDKLTLNAWIPSQAASVFPNYIDSLKQNGKYFDAILQHRDGSRPITLLFYPDKLQLVDIPTTLRVICERFKRRFPNDATLAGELIKSEFARFHSSLQHWKEEYASDENLSGKSPREKIGQFLKDKVSIQTLPTE